VQLRRATPADIPQMRKLEQQSPNAAHWDDAHYDALFISDAPGRLATVAIDDPDGSSLKGFLIARCLPDEWEVENIIVAVDARRRGIATALIRELANEALASGVESIILEVRESNSPARRLYENIGFNHDGLRIAYYENPTEDAILYRLSLHSCDKIP
jgi:ribosomal-protein-alanine N-acetyltransferase